jgi:signal transduction histidine kinase
MMDEQARAYETLDKLAAAAPPVAAARIGEVRALLEHMRAENIRLAARLRAAETRSQEMPAVVAPPISDEAWALAADLGEMLPESPRPDTGGLAAVLGAIGVQPDVPTVKPVDRLGTSVLPGNDQVEGAMPTADAIVPRFRVLLRPLLQHLYDETGFGTRARSKLDELLGLLDTLDRLNAVRRGLIVVHPIVFDPAELLRQARRNLGGRAVAKDQQLHVDGDVTLPSVLADGDLAQEVLDSILDNAIRYTDYGGEIRVTAESVGTHILFTITDTGIGLEPDDMARIGTPFFRSAQQPMVQGQAGAGLRLFIARQLLDIQGGELFYSGEPGLGASFSFTLPVAGQ